MHKILRKRKPSIWSTVLFGLKMKPHPHYKALYYAFVYHLSKYIEDVLDIIIFIKTQSSDWVWPNTGSVKFSFEFNKHARLFPSDTHTSFSRNQATHFRDKS